MKRLTPYRPDGAYKIFPRAPQDTASALKDYSGISLVRVLMVDIPYLHLLSGPLFEIKYQPKRNEQETNQTHNIRSLHVKQNLAMAANDDFHDHIVQQASL
jgi:hypothetical protein